VTHVIETHSADETERAGYLLAEMLRGVAVLALYGGLGAGKTTLTRGLAAGLGCSLAATSPSYTLVNEYPGPRPVCHFDMYRLSGCDALWEIGWEDYLASGALCIIEWSERVEDALPADCARLTLEVTGENSRRITLTLPEKGGASC